MSVNDSDLSASPGRQGQRRIPWTLDEELLVFDLYLRCGPRRAHHREVIELSEALRRLPIHDTASRSDDFRSPASVQRKMEDIRTHQPGYRGIPTRGSAIDRAIWKEFGDRPEDVRRRAEFLRAELNGLLSPEDDEEEIADLQREGRLFYRQHRVRERSPKLRSRKIAAVKKANGLLSCEACAVRLGEAYGRVGDEVYECHHLVPLHVTGEVVTTLGDVALLCPTCHRIAHRMQPWPTLDELRPVVRRNSS